MKIKKYKKNYKTKHSKDSEVYIGREALFIYIGAPNGLDYAQIRLNDEQFIWLYKVMSKMIEKDGVKG